jgi:hypothetical protein
VIMYCLFINFFYSTSLLNHATTTRTASTVTRTLPATRTSLTADSEASRKEQGPEYLLLYYGDSS